jgi:Zn ribbon nucleic-acid-binding protein
MVMGANERRVANINARDISILVLPNSEEKNTKKEKTKAEGLKVEAEETCEEEQPDNPPCAEEDEPTDDGWFCPQCSESPCQFLQWQEELERIVDCMNPDLSNKQRRYELYQHVARRRHGTLGKDNRKPFPSCFEQGMRDLYSSEKYTGYQTAYNSGPDDGSTPVYKFKNNN